MLKKLKRRRLRVDILSIFVAIFVSTVFLIIYYSHTTSTKAILKVGNDLIAQTHVSIINRLDNFLRPQPYVAVATYLLQDGELQAGDMDMLTSVMPLMLQSYPQLMNVYLADEKGNIFIENKILPSNQIAVPFTTSKSLPKETAFISEFILNKNGKPTLTVIYQNKQGTVLKRENSGATSFDPRTRPWYQGAKKPNEQSWIGIYPFYGTKQEGVSFAFPVRSNNHFTGAAGADLNINAIENELLSYKKLKGFVFFINNKQKIIEKNLPDIHAINNPVIAKAADLHQLLKKNIFTFRLNQTNYTAQFSPYAANPSETWELASVIPVGIFIAPVAQANAANLLFSLIMFALGLFLVAFFANSISRPVMRLADETKKITRLDFEKTIKTKSNIYEIQIMAEALNTAKYALSSFAKYVPKKLIKQLMDSKIIAQIGGKKEYVTIMFTDIENFTELSEKMDPEDLLLHLSEYLNALTQIIQLNKGVIDKYIGDSIMSFWGAPIPDSEHASHACEAALAGRSVVDRLNQKWKNEGKPVLPTRFGIHSGEAVVGNMGSSDRLNYTVLGDAVNLAARLESCNKIFKTQIIVSESVYAKCRDLFEFRFLDHVYLKGKQQSVAIYELLSKTSS